MNTILHSVGREIEMSESRLNIELFKKVRDRIAAVPESYDQSTYRRADRRAPCGTAACLAGEAIICDAPTVEDGVAELREYDDVDFVAERAAELLGLPQPDWGKHSETGDGYNVTARLFACHEDYEVFWPEPFASQFAEAGTTSERSRVAVAYLDHIIATGKVLE